MLWPGNKKPSILTHNNKKCNTNGSVDMFVEEEYEKDYVSVMM